MQLTKLQKKLCNELQRGLPIASRPYSEIARRLGADEETVLREIANLKRRRIIRRIGVVINYQVIGQKSTLIVACVPKSKLSKAAKAINTLEAVSHNYIRKHHYNLWFTLRAGTWKEIERTLTKLGEQLDIEFHNLPARKVFKLDARFDAEDDRLLSGPVKRPRRSKRVKLTAAEKRILSLLGGGTELVERPFALLCGSGQETGDVLKTVKALVRKDVIRRLSGVVYHRKLGFTSNVLFVCRVNQAEAGRVGKKLADISTVSHCYERKTFKGWHYNLYAMMHAKNKQTIEKAVSQFIRAEGIKSFELLETVQELKKTVSGL